MIEGLKLDLKATELIEHLRARAAYHRERAAWFTSQKETIAKGMKPDEIEEEERDFRAFEQNPTIRLQQRASEHSEKVQLFEFMAEHIVPSETYRLDDNDLKRIEIIKDRYY